MEKLFIWAGILVGIVLCLTGIIKLPFKSFKEKHPNFYKAVFTMVSCIISVVLCILCELYLLSAEIISFEFTILVCAVLAGVFSGYSGIYEGLGLKELVKNIISHIRRASAVSKDKRIKNILTAAEGIEKIVDIIEEEKYEPGDDLEKREGEGDV